MTNLPPLYADDPDAHRTYPVTARTGLLDWPNPVVKVDGLDVEIAAEWQGDPGATRSIRVPLFGLPAGYLLYLRLVVDGDNDLRLNDRDPVVLRSDQPGTFPSNPGTPGGPVAWGDISGKPTTYPPAPHNHDDLYYRKAQVDALLEDLPTTGVSIDHGSVGSTLTITEAGSHELDLTGDLAVTVSTEGDVTLFVHGTGTVTVAGQEFEVDGDEVIVVVTSPRGVQSAFMVGAAGASPEPVEDPPTQPGVVSVTPTSDGYDLSWIASTVAAGYEGALDGGTYTDYGTTPSKSLTGLAPGSEHSGTIRAYNSVGQRSTARAWGPATVAAVGLHEQLLAHDPDYYLRTSRDSLESFGDGAGTWSFVGSPSFAGPALMGGETGSTLIGDGSPYLRNLNAAALSGAVNLTVVALVRGNTGLTRMLDAAGLLSLGASSNSPGNYFNEYARWGNTHLWAATVGPGNGGNFQWRDGVAVNIDSQPFNSGNALADGAARIGEAQFGGGGGFYLSHFAVFVNKILTGTELTALATAAGTLGNPA